MVQTWKNPEVFFHPGGPHPFLSVAVFQGWCLPVLLRAWMGPIEFPGKDDGRRRWGYVPLRPWHPFWKPTKWKGNQHIPTLVLGARNVTFKKAVSRKEILYLARFDSWYLTWALTETPTTSEQPTMRANTNLFWQLRNRSSPCMCFYYCYIVHALRAPGCFGNPRILWKFQEKTNRN